MTALYIIAVSVVAWCAMPWVVALPRACVATRTVPGWIFSMSVLSRPRCNVVDVRLFFTYVVCSVHVVGRLCLGGGSRESHHFSSPATSGYAVTWPVACPTT